MRPLVFLLLLLNLLFLTWAQGLLWPAEANPVHQPLNPEQIRIVTPQDLQKELLSPTPEEPHDLPENLKKAENLTVVTRCLLFSNLSREGLEKLVDMASEKFPAFTVSRREQKQRLGLLEFSGPEVQADALRHAASELLPKSQVGECR